MKKTLLIAMAILLSVASVSAQTRHKHKQHVEEEEEPAPVAEAYQVVNVTKEASVCYDTLTKAYDLVCFVSNGNTQKTVNVKLGVTWTEVAAGLHRAMDENDVKFLTISKVIRYFIMERRMPADNYVMEVDYCTAYSLKLNLSLVDYGFDKLPITFALAEPKGDTFKDRTNLSGQLSPADKETVRGLIKEGFIKNDVEASYFIRIIDGPELDIIEVDDQSDKENGKKAKEDKKEKKEKADKKDKSTDDKAKAKQEKKDKKESAKKKSK